MRVLAVDWSGARSGERRKIWLAEVAAGRLLRLQCGRNRDELAAHLVDEKARDPRMVVGLDFAFSLPAWFLANEGIASAAELWRRAAAGEAERWLAACEPPFWGRPGKRRPAHCEQYRLTDRAVEPVAGVRPKPVFQLGGAGAVGTGSLRGMPVLHRLREAGFAVWPFDPPALPLVVEIYPRTFTDRIVKSSEAARAAFLRHERFAHVPPALLAAAVSCEDAFDAAVSALGMWEHRDPLNRLPAVDDTVLRLEGIIWRPAWAPGQP